MVPCLFITPCWPCSRLSPRTATSSRAASSRPSGTIGHLYQVLDRLARDGLITSDRQPQPVKPDRLVHRITPAGHEELDRWLNEPSVRTRGYRDDFFLKVMAAAQAADPDLLAAVLRRQRAHLLTELRSLAEARAAAARSPVVALLVTAAELHVRADLGIVDAAERDLTPATLDALRVPTSPAVTPPGARSESAS
jgi:DNA-binding PadR family transcriptional regulator